MFQGKTTTTQDTDTKNHPEHMTQIKNHWSAADRMLGKLPECSFHLINIFPEFQIPYLHFFPSYKKSWLDRNVRQSSRVHKLPSSQLNNAPIKIQFLSLLVGSAGDSTITGFPVSYLGQNAIEKCTFIETYTILKIRTCCHGRQCSYFGTVHFL